MHKAPFSPLTKPQKFGCYSKIKVAKMIISLYDRQEKTVGKGENTGNQHFLLFPQYFPKPSSLGSSKVKSHTSANTTFLSKATDYFSHMLLWR